MSSGRRTCAFCSRAQSEAGASEGSGGDDSACYLQILLRLRLRGLQLDERSRGLGDHFLQQVIIWVKSGACRLSSLALPTLSAPACACPDSPGTFVPQKSRLPAPLEDLVLAEQTVLSSGPFLEEFSSAAPFFTPLVQDPLPLHLVAHHSL